MREEEAENQFVEHINELWGTIQLCGYEYEAAFALKRCDPIAYRVAFLEWADGQGINLI